MEQIHWNRVHFAEARPSSGIIRADLPHNCEIVHIGEKKWKGVVTRGLKALVNRLPT
jgi:hypothetical protein